MKPPHHPLRVLIAGGGVAALEATLALRALAEERVSIELLAPEPHFWYRPLTVVEPFGTGHVHGLELAALAHECGARFTLGALASVEPDRHLARTAAGAEIEYDALLVASGAMPVAAVAGALTFRGPADNLAFRDVLTELESGAVRHLVFAMPGGVTWPLPLYELALLTSAFLDARAITSVQLAVVTPEEAPLGLFGAEASTAVRRLLEDRDVALHTRRLPMMASDGALAVSPRGRIRADRVVALPRLRGRPIEGLPRNANGFLPTDRHARVTGVADVFAAGDVTAFPVKQGGIAAQQADAAAETIAATAGADVTPRPFHPVLRGLLLTGSAPTYLRTQLPGGAGDTSTARTDPLWWPPAKIVGRHLAPFLAERAGAILSPPAGADTVRVEVDLAAVSPG
ncbi:MAG TPA: FAD-dependent oxidoreductase [Gaiellaceae bacterium]